MSDLNGKVAIVAGGAGYLGMPACKALAAQGARVAVADINPERIEQAVAEIVAISSPDAVMGVTFDINDESRTMQAVEGTVKRFGRLDTAVIATFVHAGPDMEDITPEEFDAAMHSNVTGAFVMARAAADAMHDGGSIILYASMYGLIAPVPDLYEPPMKPNPIEYGTAKAAIIQMTRYLAARYGRRNIRVNAVVPGAFPWPSQQQAAPEFTQRLAARTMLGRVGRRDETAGAVVFLASDQSSYVTGHMLCVDGGWTAW